jgi:ketosteroid isomerase-like protein
MTVTQPSTSKENVSRYMDAYHRGDRALVLSCLADDVEWIVPGAFHLHGRDAFAKEIDNPAFVGLPEITVSRLTSENDIVVAEGNVRTQRSDGVVMQLAYCDVFELQAGVISRLTSYLMELRDA